MHFKVAEMVNYMQWGFYLHINHKRKEEGRRACLITTPAPISCPWSPAFKASFLTAARDLWCGGQWPGRGAQVSLALERRPWLAHGPTVMMAWADG